MTVELFFPFIDFLYRNNIIHGLSRFRQHVILKLEMN